MIHFPAFRESFDRLRKACTPSLARDITYERDNALRQYLVEKNRATHYEMLAQKWLTIAHRHQNILDSTAKNMVDALVDGEKK